MINIVARLNNKISLPKSNFQFAYIFRNIGRQVESANDANDNVNDKNNPHEKTESTKSLEPETLMSIEFHSYENCIYSRNVLCTDTCIWYETEKNAMLPICTRMCILVINKIIVNRIEQLSFIMPLKLEK